MLYDYIKILRDLAQLVTCTAEVYLPRAVFLPQDPKYFTDYFTHFYKLALFLPIQEKPTFMDKMRSAIVVDWICPN